MREAHIVNMLEAAKGIGATLGELCGAFLVSKGESYRRLHAMREMRPPRRKLDQEDLHRRHFAVLLYKLKQQGFIKSDPKKRRWFMLTKRGKKKLSALRKKQKNSLPPNLYSTTSSSEVVIVMFDVPERDRKKRQWLRFSLRNMGFSMAQRSVWIGKVKIPKEFLENIRLLGLLRYVEILAVTRRGSLERQL